MFTFIYRFRPLAISNPSLSLSLLPRPLNSAAGATFSNIHKFPTSEMTPKIWRPPNLVRETEIILGDSLECSARCQLNYFFKKSHFSWPMTSFSSAAPACFEKSALFTFSSTISTPFCRSHSQSSLFSMFLIFLFEQAMNAAQYLFCVSPHFPDKLFTINHFQCHFFHFISHS